MPHDGSTFGNGNPGKEARRIALVDGDVTEDFHIATMRGPGDASLWHKEPEKVPAKVGPGGAALLGKLIQNVATGIVPEWEVICRSPNDSKFPTLYTVWYQYEPLRQPKGWRISKFLGSDPASEINPIAPLTDEPTAEVIVIDDKGHRFRKERDWWNGTLNQSNQDTWFVVRAGRPLEDKGMWKELRTRGANVIGVTTADDIRRREVFVSRRLSWERTTQDLNEEILKPALSQFEGCAFVVVCFTTSAVVVMERVHSAAATEAATAPGPESGCWLIYDPSSLEDEEWRDAANGRIYGYTYCITAAIARYLFQRLPERPQAEGLNEAIKSGLTASRNLYEEGFELKDGAIVFPVERVTSELVENPDTSWGIVKVPRRDAKDGWTIFETQAASEGGLEALAKTIVRKGFADDLLKKLPFYRVGDLVVADRREIEGYRSIQRLLKEYAAPPTSGVARPLSIAVFGQPGSGKSYSIEQLAKSEIGGIGFAPLTFNLSQMTKPDELRGAYHQIRDKSLSGKLPLVFWDEFDYALDDKELGG